MKKIVAVLVLALAASARATEWTDPDTGITWNYKVSGNNVTLGGDGEHAISEQVSGAIKIPSTLDGLPVTSIGDCAFFRCNGLTSVTIPDTVTSIGDSAFYCCSGLTSLVIPNRVANIGANAFQYCSGLTSVTTPNSVTSIGKRAFDSCTGLKQVELGNCVTNIGDDAFRDCSGLTNFTIPNRVTSLGRGVFHGCKRLASITLPDSVTSIRYCLFFGCSSLTGVAIPNTVTSIDGSAFYGCSGLTGVKISNSVTNIGEYAFRGCKGLETINLPNRLAKIGQGAFCECSSLTSVEIPNSVDEIEYEAFEECENLHRITVPRCLLETNTQASVLGTRALALRFDEGRINEIIFPEGIEYIAAQTLVGFTELHTVKLPSSIKHIDSGVFMKCPKLELILVPEECAEVLNDIDISEDVRIEYCDAHEDSDNSLSIWFVIVLAIVLWQLNKRGKLDAAKIFATQQIKKWRYKMDEIQKSSAVGAEQQTNIDQTGEKNISTVWLWAIALGTIVAVIIGSIMNNLLIYFATVAITVEMDLRTLKKAGFTRTKGWRWIGLVFPIAYVVLRIYKTSQTLPKKTFASDKEKLFDCAKLYAPALAWLTAILLFSLVSCCADSSGDDVAMLEKQVRIMIEEKLSDSPASVKDLTIVHIEGNRYKGFVELSNGCRTEKVTVDVLFDGRNIILQASE